MPAVGPFRLLFAGGDRRSVAGSARVRAAIAAAPERIAELAGLAHDEDWLVSMRALDLLEKLAREHPERVSSYKGLFISPLADSAKWEVRLQCVRALPLFRWTPAERKRVLEILERDLEHPQLFVRAWALDSLSIFSLRDKTLMPSVLKALEDFERSGRNALISRARKIRERIANREDPGERRSRARASRRAGRAAAPAVSGSGWRPRQ